MQTFECWRSSRSAVGLALFTSLYLAGCRFATEPERSSRRIAPEPANALIVDQLLTPRTRGERSELYVARSPHETGIDWIPTFPADAPVAAISDLYSGNGVCVGDVDADGLPDIFLTNYDLGNRLYRNLGDFRFEDVTDKAGVSGGGRWCSGACMADVDNDNDLDLFVCAYDAPNLLYINQGGGRFEDQARERGVDFAGASVMMVVADYDRDGDLDSYLVTHRMNLGTQFRLPSSTEDAAARGIIQRTDSERGVRVTAGFRELFQLVDRGGGRVELAIAGQQDYLYQNDGGGNFHVVNPSAGIVGFGIGLAASWWDYDSDGWLDLYVSNDYKGADQLYRNQGDGTFQDVARTALPHTPWFSMGSAAADVNNDGLVDLLASDMSGTTHYRQKVAMGDMEDTWFLRHSNPPQYMRNALYLNTATPRLMEIAQLAGVSNSDWTWSPLFGDLDNDGWIDLFVSNGMSRDFMDSDIRRTIKDKQSHQWMSMPVLRESNLAFRNTGQLRFDRAEVEWGLDQMSASYGAALADLDRDGDLDVLATNFESPLMVYENQGTDHHAVTIRLVGTTSNRWGVGASVRIRTSNDLFQIRTLTASQGVMSSAEPLLHFGLGDATFVDRLSVAWPSGLSQTFFNLDADRLYSITEPDGDVSAEPTSPPPIPLFANSNQLAWVQHRETQFDDFESQPLLPAKLSQLGPGLAVADVTGDDVDDLFVSGAHGQTGQMIDGATQQSIAGDAFLVTPSTEQLGALLVDVDGDRDRDLFVVTGGVELKDRDERLRDQLYINQGMGTFVAADVNSLPDLRESGTCVAAADYDRDGDVDLFVGGFVAPGQYPMSPSSRLLRNDGGHFVVDAKAWESDAVPVMRVTNALWSDVDQDGWVDLLVAQKWGPVRLLHNDEGILRERTEDAGLSAWTGWWNGIAAGDLDLDGDIDYVVTNQGLNSSYQADREHPVVLYYGDFTGHGDLRIVEAIYEADHLYPQRGLSCSSAAIPILKERFTSFQQFARATLDEVYPKPVLQQAMRLEANTLQSGILWNEDEGQLRFEPLPRLAQASSAYGVIIVDLDGDGATDIYLVHNSNSPQPETGNQDGGVSLLLRGRGDGRFTPVWPAQSGLSIPDDTKSLVVTDWNRDGRPDLLAGLNDTGVRLFENQSAPPEQFFVVKLRGPRGNFDAIGATVTLELSDHSRRVGEVYAGGGYLSQSSSQLHFGLGEESVRAVIVRWPDGTTTVHSVSADVRSVRIDAVKPSPGDQTRQNRFEGVSKSPRS